MVDPATVNPTPAPVHKGWLRLIPGFIISLVSLGIVLYIADPRQLGTALQLADYRLLALSIFTTLVWLAVRAMAWRTLLQEQAGYRQIFLTINEGYLLNNVLPFRLGEFGRAFLLARKAGLEFWQVFSTIIIERILDVAMSAALLLCTLPFVVGTSWAAQAAIVAVGIVILGLGTLYLLARYQSWTIAMYNRLGERWPWVLRVGGNRLPAFFSGLTIMTQGTRFLSATGWIVLDWAIALGQQYLLLRAFFPQAHFLWAAFSMGVVTMGIAAPSSPGAVGVMELALVGALALFHLDHTTALAFALTVHLLNYLITGIIGSFALAHDGESLLGLYHKLMNRRAANSGI